MTVPGGRFGAMLVCLAVGTAGGFVFKIGGLPMPWMLGAMSANIILALSGVRLSVPMPLVAVMIGALGAISGSSFDSDFLQHLPGWWLSLLVVVLFVFAAAGAMYWILRRYFGYTMLTAYFSASPGGLTMMSVIGQAMGGDVRQIALVHSIRLALTLVGVSVFLSLTGHAAVDPTSSGGAPIHMSLADGLMAVACVALGVPLANRLKIDGGNFLGPLFLSMALHMSGAGDFHVPNVVAAVAQVVMGSSIGTRFSDTTVSRIAGTLMIGALTAVIAMGLAIAITVAFAGPLDVPASALLISLAPAGFPMMVLVAIALNLDVAFVTTHQLARVAIITLLGPALIRYIARKSGITIGERPPD